MKVASNIYFFCVEDHEHFPCLIHLILLWGTTQHYGNWILCNLHSFMRHLKNVVTLHALSMPMRQLCFFSTSVQNISGIKVSHYFPYFQFTDEVKSEFLEHRSCNATDLFKSLSLSNPRDFFRLGCLLSTWVINAVRPCSPSVSSSALSNEANAIIARATCKTRIIYL